MAGYEHLCLGCMADIGSESICPHCGWKVGTAAEAPQHLPPGTILQEKYLLGRVLGHGGFGITYLAWDLNLNMKLAIKEYMPRDFATRSADQTMVSVFSGDHETHFENGLRNFLDEAKTVAQFSHHPGIVGVRDFFRENGTAYLVMYYLEGIDFKQYLESQGGKIPYQTALRIMMPVMDALREVHQTGTLHRDISPDNIYITAEGQVKILDFGAARHAISEFSKSISVILKPGYAPEEQYRSKGKQGPWTDIYATAATLYRAIVGEVPPESLDRLEEDSIVPPSSLGVDIPKHAEAALLKALSLRAADRFQTMEEFQQELLKEMDLNEEQNVTEPHHQFKTVPSASEANMPKKKKPISKWVWIGGGAAVVAFLSVGILVVLFLIGLMFGGEELANSPDPSTKKNQAIETLKELTVPNLVNAYEKDAKALLTKEGLKLGEITYVESLYVKKGVVTKQSMAADEKINANDAINLEVSKGIELPMDEESIKTQHLDIVYDYWDEGYKLNEEQDYLGALKYYIHARDMAEIIYKMDGNFDAQYSMGVLDRNITLMKRVLGYYEFALADIESSVAILEDLLTKDPVFKKDHSELANSYGELSHIQFLNQRPNDAITSAKKSIAINPEKLLFKVNLAHAYLFADEFDSAVSLYKQHQEELVNDTQSFKDVVLEDFKYFKQEEIQHPDMEKIEKMYASPEAEVYTDEDEIHITIYANGFAIEDENVDSYMVTIDPNSPGYAATEKSISDLFATYDQFVVTIENIEVLEINGDAAKAKVVQVITYTDGTQNYESKSTMTHHLVRSDGLFKWLISSTDVEGG
ncbi:protein kinase domain-containing protein [Robertmurraya andreesenii]|uniref:non-specific serine/threonine protein kinase n=1 Tax=Anoxybacillus andreesenii TaxID=1325932 RepID=A0ABT9V0R6_9BACL|nr:protein kinase [Robertmurraya andreesenii]MDQ0154542.1 serine/threonine protein kinase [Robertmurraya andreesenii]